jgi:hypothetical protein
MGLLLHLDVGGTVPTQKSVDFLSHTQLRLLSNGNYPPSVERGLCTQPTNRSSGLAGFSRKSDQPDILAKEF